jgi:type VI secretion system protein ImpL
VIDLYEKEYIRVWDAFLGDLGLASIAGTENLKRALRTLGGPTSPLRSLLKTVDDNTFLVKQAAPGQSTGVLSSTQEAFNKILKQGQKIVGLPTGVPGAQVTQHFAPIHTLMAGEAGAAPIDRLVEQIKQLQERLEPIGAGIGQEVGDVATLAAVGRASESLKQDAAGLPDAVGSLITEVGNSAQAVSRGGLRASLIERYRQEVVRECTMAVQDRYPFSSGSATDVPINDFGRIFGYSGIFDRFYKENLDRLVDNSRTPWQWRADASGEAVGLGQNVLRQFEQAQKIRETFFRPGASSPELKFNITFENLNQAASRVVIEIDGQPFAYRFEAARALSATWPGGPNPGTAAVTFEERGGGRPNTEFKGAWALFKMFDSAQMRPVATE